MAREIIWTDPAWDDAENAADYIAQDSKFYAAAIDNSSWKSRKLRLHLPPLPREARMFPRRGRVLRGPASRFGTRRPLRVYRTSQLLLKHGGHVVAGRAQEHCGRIREVFVSLDSD